MKDPSFLKRFFWFDVSVIGDTADVPIPEIKISCQLDLAFGVTSAIKVMIILVRLANIVLATYDLKLNFINISLSDVKFGEQGGYA